MYSFNGSTTLNGGDAGIDILASDGSFTFADATITNPTGGACQVDGGAPTVNYTGDIANNAGPAIRVANTTGGAVNFLDGGANTIADLGGEGIIISIALGNASVDTSYTSTNGIPNGIRIENSSGTYAFADGTGGGMRFDQVTFDASGLALSGTQATASGTTQIGQGTMPGQRVQGDGLSLINDLAHSPVLFGDLVISVCMQDSLADLGGPLSPSYVVAHDKRTGQPRWKTLRMTGARKEANDAYTTPIFHERADGVDMIIMGGTQIDAYDPITGKQRWVVPGLGGNRVITGPTIAHGMAYATVGMRGPLLAVRLTGQGLREKDDAIAWQLDRGTPDSPTPVVWDDLLFVVNNNGVARGLDAHTGREYWTQRLTGGYRASPIAADGRIYFLNTTGKCTVVAAAKAFKKLAENEIDDETLASPVVSDGRIILRGRKALYCLGRS